MNDSNQVEKIETPRAAKVEALLWGCLVKTVGLFLFLIVSLIFGLGVIVGIVVNG